VFDDLAVLEALDLHLRAGWSPNPWTRRCAAIRSPSATRASKASRSPALKETRQLRYFVAVAEELHFGRAADRLGVAQPSLSRAVRGLEGVLGTQLFERSTRHVGLTSAGQSLLIDARAALDAVSSAGRRAVRAGLARPSLAIASKPDGDAGVLCEVLAALQREAPGVEAELLFAAAGDQAATMLRDGRADVALVPAPFDERGLDWKCSPRRASSRFRPLTRSPPRK